jgi:hypothetical protein
MKAKILVFAVSALILAVSHLAEAQQSSKVNCVIVLPPENP